MAVTRNILNTFNKEYLKDRIHACWLGKNLGGTMGAPYEDTQAIHDIQGFSTPEGVVLPNDDLDLQLIWLMAFDDLGPQGITANALSEYWLSYNGVWWNEYGVAKSNLLEGLVPPLAGEMNNDEWKHSNGAWIRTEIWACLYPGQPDKAIALAFEDASIDHGYGEGTYATIFVAAIESAAFVIQDIHTLLKIGLSKIPSDCRVARSVNLIIKDYTDGVDWKTARNKLVKDSEDLGWFRAPANVAFAVLGLLYGEGDFKKTMILAINCGDDTDCTAATVGALMGIMKGTAGLPEDWCRHIGDDIVTLCNIKGSNEWPANCRQLTELIMIQLPVAFKMSQRDYLYYGEKFKLSDEENDFSGISVESLMGDAFSKKMFSRSPYSFRIKNVYAEAWVEFDREPYISFEKPLNGKISVSINTLPEQKHFHLRWLLPKGWKVTGKMNLHANSPHSNYKTYSSADFSLSVSEDAVIEANNRLILELTCPGRSTSLLVPIVVLS